MQFSGDSLRSGVESEGNQSEEEEEVELKSLVAGKSLEEVINTLLFCWNMADKEFGGAGGGTSHAEYPWGCIRNSQQRI